MLPLILAWAAAMPGSIVERRLDNGLVVILAPDPATPQIAINLRYRVGASNDPPGRAGLAHVLEHMMFQDTQQLKADAFATTLEEAGAISVNAYTTYDRTAYTALIPPEVLPLALWLEAERMTGLAPSADRLKKELGVVKNEWFERIEQQPYARAEIALHQAMFAPIDPMARLPIGTPEEFEAIAVEDLTNFHRTHYHPGNATLVLTGRFEVEAANRLIDRYLGDLPGRPLAETQRTFQRTRKRRASAAERLARRVKLSMIWSIPPGEDEATWELFAEMFSGLTSRASLANINDAVIDQTWAYVYGLPGARFFRLDALLPRGVLPDLAKAKLETTLNTYVRWSTDTSEIRAARGALRLGVLLRQESLEGRAELIQRAFARGGKWKKEATAAGRWDHVTGASVQNVLGRIRLTPPFVMVAQPIGGRR